MTQDKEQHCTASGRKTTSILEEWNVIINSKNMINKILLQVKKKFFLFTVLDVFVQYIQQSK
jgi:hypothetical protein